MSSSSPDYAITKPGMTHFSRRREKPLRTYGRRPDARGEPPSKKRRTSPEARISESPVTESPVTESPVADSPAIGSDAHSNPPTTEPHTQLPQQTVKKGSILNYFKPVVVPLPPSQLATEVPSTTEETSPPRKTVPPRKRPRTLRIRPISPPSRDLSNDIGEEEQEASESSRTSTPDTLRDGGDALHNSRPEPRKRKLKAVALVQTTLDITAAPSFSECRICDTVWNPLYPDDVKYHSKRHATVLRTRKKMEQGL